MSEQSHAPALLCVRSRDRWCYTEDTNVSENENSIATACDYVVVMPWGLEIRQPDCPECLALIEETP